MKPQYNTKPDFSCIIPLYNKGKHIARTIDSVLNQDFEHFELIIVNDGSTDNSINVVKTYSDIRIKIINQANQGVSIARNVGIANSKADLIAFLDADDEWLSNHLKDIYELYKQYPNCGAFSCNFLIMLKNGIQISSNIRAVNTNSINCIVDNYCKSCALTKGPLTGPINSSTAVIRKTVFKDIGCFKEGISNNEDLDFWLRLSIKYRIAFTWNVGVKIDRTLQNQRPLKTNDERDYFLIISGNELLEKKCIKNVFWLKEYINRVKLIYSKNLIRHGYRMKALSVLLKTKTIVHLHKKLILVLAISMPKFIIDSIARSKIKK